ncbi:MAG: hypothetical protein ABSC76_05435 [Terracidiphilus sp.]|jgi:hypothetical protein
MKRRVWISIGVALAGCGVVFAIGAVEQAMKPEPELPALLPEGALLSIEARDFQALLKDWNTSEEKRAWITSDNHAAFSNSRLFTRLSQAQDEFSAAAGLTADDDLLEKVAGKESCLGLYDIGNLEFVYVTHLDQQEIENTPLWLTRSKFEQRTEAGNVFYVHKDAQSSRTAAFAARGGWLILGTREDLVAGVLDRFAGGSSHSLLNEGWFAEAVKHAPGERGDLRMVLNLEMIVPSPYFRSYWVQQNITEMKQYTAAVSDLYRSSESYREERVLVRRAGAAAPVQGDVRTLAALAPEDAAFYAAEASPDPESLLQTLRENLLEEKPARAATSYTNAPSAARAENAGSAAQLDVQIDKAPVVVARADAFQPLRALLQAVQPDAALEVYTTRAPQEGVYVSLQTAMAVSALRDWDEDAVRRALTQTLLPGLTAGNLGVQWEKRSSVISGGDYSALDGAVPLYAVVRGKQLLLANDPKLLERLLARSQSGASLGGKDSVTYAALFRHKQEQGNFRRLMTQLDLAGHRGEADPQAESEGGQSPAFFSGNAASFSRAFSKLVSERIEERDRGATVTQTVTYQWSR